MAGLSEKPYGGGHRAVSPPEAWKGPYYAFEENVGYGTSKHIEGLKEYGPTEIHRMSFLNNILER